MTISGIKSNAKQTLKGNWGGAILLEFIVLLIVNAGAFVTSGPASAAQSSYYLALLRGSKKTIDGAINDGFATFGRSLIASLIVDGVTLAMTLPLLVVALLPFFFWQSIFVNNVIPDLFWILFAVLMVLGFLMFIPMIWFTIKTRFVYEIMIDNPKLSGLQCIKESFKMTKGKFGFALLFDLSFILWIIGIVFTFGLLALYAQPFMSASNSQFYLELTAQKEGIKIGEVQPAADIQVGTDGTAVQTNNADTLYCPNCKKVIDSDSAYCGVCGAKVN